MNDYYTLEYLDFKIVIIGTVTKKVFCYYRNTAVKIPRPRKPFSYLWNDFAQYILKRL
jgi:hypothetical protein